VASFVFSSSQRLKKRERNRWEFWRLQSLLLSFVRSTARATAFYRDTLGLTVAYEDSFAAVFNIGGVTLRVSRVADFTPHEHTVLGFNVPDVEATVKALREKGITFNIYPGFRQDELGILTLPGGTVRVAWFKDPDGNVLSVTNA
jgi:catechol 2,3-dioxygenase-like lactoylglutathione lyase family enzyme